VTAEVRELPLAAQVDVRGECPAGFPREPNTTAVVDGRTVLWLGPDEWLVLGGSEADFAGMLAAVDVSANRVALEVDGPAATDVLAQGCALDLHESAFATGACAQTLLARVEVILHRTTPEAFTILVRPSFAPYLRAWLDDAVSGIESPT
jgi:sarcosine oxidase subunit gamma